MRIHKEGYQILRNFLFFLLVINLLSFIVFEANTQIKILLITVFFYGLILQFFRDPKRTPNISENSVISPSDGRVVAIKEIVENEYFNDKRIQISIFMSPLNVHVNWYPITGEVKYAKYHPGNYLIAFHPKSSEKNEHTSIVLSNSKTEVMYRQIAGYLARRIVFYPRVGEFVHQCDNSGFIKFGSRLDIILPKSAKVRVRLKQKVKGAKTILAEV